MFFFGDREKGNFKNILTNKENKGLEEEFITWKLLTVFLPLITFIAVVILNLMISGWEIECFYSFFNNGSLPILSFGIISSGMPYLLEQLKEFPDYQATRRRVMALSMFVLFLSASLYILETLSTISTQSGMGFKTTIFISSIYIFLAASSIAYKMFLLQSRNIKEYAEDIREGVDDLKAAVSDLE